MQERRAREERGGKDVVRFIQTFTSTVCCVSSRSRRYENRRRDRCSSIARKNSIAFTITIGYADTDMRCETYRAVARESRGEENSEIAGICRGTFGIFVSSRVQYDRGIYLVFKEGINIGLLFASEHFFSEIVARGFRRSSRCSRFRESDRAQIANPAVLDEI